MKDLVAAIGSMISISPEEIDTLLTYCSTQHFRPKEFLSEQGVVADSVFFIQRGITRSIITDKQGQEHTIHFSTENQFICDYSSFMLKLPATNGIQAIEETEVVVLPRKAIDWGYTHLREGEKLGRLIAEYYFICFDERLKSQYLSSPAQRYENITRVFPNIHNRAPQHMIASYLGVSPVHLSRLKKESR